MNLLFILFYYSTTCNRALLCYHPSHRLLQHQLYVERREIKKQRWNFIFCSKKFLEKLKPDSWPCQHATWQVQANENPENDAQESKLRVIRTKLLTFTYKWYCTLILTFFRHFGIPPQNSFNHLLHTTDNHDFSFVFALPNECCSVHKN